VTREELIETIDPAPDTDHPAWDAFVKYMVGRQYGTDPATSAWYWFASGYDEAESTPADPRREPPR
jgi:hypothetical protein